MRLVIADTSPVNYLILIGCIDLLPHLFERVILPSAVQRELADSGAPPEVRNWIASSPAWLEIQETGDLELAPTLDEGEAAVIALATILHADLLLIDERDGVLVARAKGFRVTGTLGILDLAAARGLVDFAQAVNQLERTNFRRPSDLLTALLIKHKRRFAEE